MASPGKREREVLEGLVHGDGTREEDGGECAPPAKSPKLSFKDGGPRPGQAAPPCKMNRFGFGLLPPKPIVVAVAGVTSSRESNQDENENRTANTIVEEVKPPTSQSLTLEFDMTTAQRNTVTTKPLTSNPKGRAGSGPKSAGSIPKPATSIPKGAKRGSALPQPRALVKPRVRRTTIPPPSSKQSTAEVVAMPTTSDMHRPSAEDSSNVGFELSPKESFVALIKDKMSVVSQIDDAIKLKRSRLKPHDWRGKFDEQKATLLDMRALLRRVVDEAKQLEQDAFKMDQTIAMDRKVLERELDHANERNQRVDSIAHEVQSNITDMQVTIGKLKSEKDRLTSELNDARTKLQGATDVHAQLVEAQTSRDQAKLEFDRHVAALTSENHALQGRLDALEQVHASEKATLSRKNDEVSTMFASLKQMLDFATSANVKLEADNTQLRAKTTDVDAQVKDLETKYTAASTSLRHVEAELQACRAAKDEAVALVAEKSELVRVVSAEVHEHIRQASVEKELRVHTDAQMRELRVEQLATNAQMEAVKAEMKHMSERHADKLGAATAALEAMEAQLQADAAAHAAAVDKLREVTVSLESELHTWRLKEADNTMVEMTALVDAKREADVLKLRLKELNHHGTQSLHEKDARIAALEAKLKDGEVQRRKMHNTIQELRGNVRVFARTRPFLPSDGTGAVSALACDGDLQCVTLKRDKETHAFTFDRVFAPVSGQDAVFEEVSEFVQSAIDGYQVCLFSYGQTGSGKTHTVRRPCMQGSGNGHMRGIIPRSIEKIMAEVTKSEAQGWRYVMHASFLEIYNETVRDLLADKADKKLVLKMDPKNGQNAVMVQDLTLVTIDSLHQVEGLMEKAARVRSVACTDMNAQSSRSHSVFSLHLRGVNDAQGTVLEGKLNLVDLAGSERLSRSGATGSRLKETQAINKSLSCLTDVFAAIGNKSPHVNLSPTVESAHESLCSLRFAQHVNQCELGKPKRQLKKKSDEDAVKTRVDMTADEERLVKSRKRCAVNQRKYRAKLQIIDNQRRMNMDELSRVNQRLEGHIAASIDRRGLWCHAEEQSILEYLRLFERGYTQSERQDSFLRYFVAPDVCFNGLIGVEGVKSYWTTRSSRLTFLHVKYVRLTPVAHTSEGTMVEMHCVIEVALASPTVAAMFPHVVRRPDLVDKLLSAPLHIPLHATYVFDDNKQVSWQSCVPNLVQALYTTFGNLNDVVAATSSSAAIHPDVKGQSDSQPA
ncbi:hypothetical protein DYB37_006220 [Aphanomyces astaci]|uniref:Kinesin motor domain-containing protein n=2 Tax=Aphanomyces astaci TaxID=112090 RepID=A0A3R6WY63_APHAT|nr:hypothetical protein DYB35_004539 [Aphanomyces astaci]RHZ34761.1 hypothetical protein DYB37_006220 [Aphanomyces astaci]